MKLPTTERLRLLANNASDTIPFVDCGEVEALAQYALAAQALPDKWREECCIPIPSGLTIMIEIKADDLDAIKRSELKWK